MEVRAPWRTGLKRGCTKGTKKRRKKEQTKTQEYTYKKFKKDVYYPEDL